MREKSVLIVEDERIVAMDIESYLITLGYDVVAICASAQEAIRVMSKESVAIVLMDICIKGEQDGIETASRLKATHPTLQIIFLTAHMDNYNVDRAIGLDPVAYLSKPFNQEELRVSLRLAQHRLSKASTPLQPHIIPLDDRFSYDLTNHLLYADEAPIHLTKKESELLELLIEHKNSLVDFYTIENTIWPDKFTSANSIRTLVKRLRQKLDHRLIETISSRGYQLVSVY